MSLTSSARKSAIKQLVAGTDPGITLGEALRDAVVVAMQSDIQVTVMHKDLPYIVSPEQILRLLAVQSPLITGQHLVNGGPTRITR